MTDRERQSLAGRLPATSQSPIVDWHLHRDPRDRFFAGDAEMPTGPHLGQSRRGDRAAPGERQSEAPLSLPTKSISSVFSPGFAPEPIPEAVALPKSLPCLTTGSSAPESSIGTSKAEPMRNAILLEPDGVTVDQGAYLAPISLNCLFSFLGCRQFFNQYERETWKTHCLSHFRHARPPGTTGCPYCSVSWNTEDGYSSWNTKLDHIADQHLSHPSRAQLRSLPDFGLYDYMWRQRIISTDVYQDLHADDDGEGGTLRPYNMINTPSRHDRTRH